MTDRFLLAILTLSTLAVGSLTIASALFDGALRAPVTVPVVQLEQVVITAKRLAPPAKVATTARTEPVAPRAQ
jgi:hypothetical protein